MLNDNCVSESDVMIKMDNLYNYLSDYCYSTKYCQKHVQNDYSISDFKGGSLQSLPNLTRKKDSTTMIHETINIKKEVGESGGKRKKRKKKRGKSNVETEENKNNDNNSEPDVLYKVGDKLLSEKEIKEENDQMKNDRLCQKCKLNNANRLFLPCAHLSSCDKCVFKCTKCPKCRSIIRGIVQVYLS